MIQIEEIGLSVSLVSLAQHPVGGRTSALGDVVQFVPLEPPQRLLVASLQSEGLDTLIGGSLFAVPDADDSLVRRLQQLRVFRLSVQSLVNAP